MSKLSSDQLKQYNDKGYIYPIDILSKNETHEIRNEIEYIENKLLMSPARHTLLYFFFNVIVQKKIFSLMDCLEV